MLETIRFIIFLALFISGLFVFGVATYGLFKFDYVLNRVHAAAKCDTLASMLILLSLMVASGFNIVSLKLFLVFVFLWLTNPVATYLTGQTEILTNKNLRENCEVDERCNI